MLRIPARKLLARSLTQAQNKALVQSVLYSTSASPLKIQFRSQGRHFNSSTKKEAGAAAPAASIPKKEEKEVAEEEPSSVHQIVGKYGWYPLGGLVTAAAVSKEVLMVGPELLVAGTFGCLFLTLYVSLSEQANAFVAKEEKEMDDHIRDIAELGVQIQKAQYEKWQAETHRPALYKEWMDEFIKTGQEMKAAAERQQRHDLYSSTHRALVGHLAAEKEARDQIKFRVLQEMQDFVIDSFKNDKKVQSAAFESALAGIGNDKPSKTDPVRDLALKFLAQKMK